MARHDDPFNADDSLATWAETGPPQPGDTVQIRLLARVVAAGEYLDVEVDELDGQRLTFRPDEVSVVARMTQESGVQES